MTFTVYLSLHDINTSQKICLQSLNYDRSSYCAAHSEKYAKNKKIKKASVSFSSEDQKASNINEES